MNHKYAEWIEAHQNPEDLLHGRGKCKTLSEAMAIQFPELRLIAGYYYDAIWGQQHHWWCVAEDSSVVDPTAAQFPTKGSGHYEEVFPQDRPIGMCMDCGGDVFHHRYNDDGERVPNTLAPSFCSPECERSTRAYLGF